jgi:hypothetical protein
MIVPELLAHGGTGGLIVEGATVLVLLVIVLVVWKSERRARSEGDGEGPPD